MKVINWMMVEVTSSAKTLWLFASVPGWAPSWEDDLACGTFMPSELVLGVESNLLAAPKVRRGPCAPTPPPTDPLTPGCLHTSF